MRWGGGGGVNKQKNIATFVFENKVDQYNISDRIHDTKWEEAVWICSCQRVQHILGSMYLVCLQITRSYKARKIAQSVFTGEHYEGKDKMFFSAGTLWIIKHFTGVLWVSS